MLRFAEDECRKRNRSQMDLNPSELRREALSLQRASAYQSVREELAVSASNKTLGGGLLRYHFSKEL